MTDSFPLSASQLRLDGALLSSTPLGGLRDALEGHLRGDGPPGLVLLGEFGSGKTTLCAELAAARNPNRPPCSVVPLRQVARAPSVEAGLRGALGPHALAEAREGQRVLLLDGLDEVARPGDGSFTEFFRDLTAQAGPRWVLTSRPGHFRTDAGEPHADQVDVLADPGVRLVQIDPLPASLIAATIGGLPGGAELLGSVEGLADLATSPLLLHVVRAALPFIEPGRPIQPWGVFDAWLRFALDTGPGHAEALRGLESLAWRAFRDAGLSPEGASFGPDDVAALHLPRGLRQALLVTDLDGHLRFGHRSVYEHLVASVLGPRIAANQGQAPDAQSGLHLSEAMRAFLVGRVAPMPVVWDRWRVQIPAGNFVSGGDRGADERPLRVQHLARPVWIARAPVTHAEWAAYLASEPADRVDANYLSHWGPGRVVPPGLAGAPIFNVWPEDADRYAHHVGARLPSADEWEKAARGLDGRRWPWGDAWRPGLAATSEMRLERPLPIRALGAAGDAGLFGAAGGVFEYTASPWRDRPGRGRVVMGGCYTHPGEVARLGLRLSHKLSGQLKAGFRLAWDA